MQVIGVKQYQQHFTNGRFFFVPNRYRYTDKVEKYLPYSAKQAVVAVKKRIQNEPFDVYMWNNSKNPEYYEFAVNTSYSEVVKDVQAGKELHKVHTNYIATALKSLVNSAIDVYKKNHK